MSGSRSRRRALAALAPALALLLCAPAAVAAQPAKPAAPARPAPGPRPESPAERLARATAAAQKAVQKAVQDYRASLERLLAVYESELGRATQLVEERTLALAKGAASRVDLEEAEYLRLAAEDNVAEARAWIEEADRLQLEVSLSDYIARLPALRPGSWQSTEAFVRYSGTVPFGLADAPKVQRFFLERVGRALPVSAWGQTVAHDRFGFDHRQAIDVAVHPDSAEGQLLAEFLRGAGIPFVAFRQAVAGAATGAHFHIGEPSRRLAVPVRR